MTTEASAPTISIDPWLALDYPLSVQELTRLAWLQAAAHLDQQGLYTKPMAAKRLAWAAFLYTSGRLSEHVGVCLEGDRS